MCGIAGIIEADDACPADAAELGAILATMRRRGPDGEGRFVDGPVALGMRRLAIVDLASGNQPFLAADGQVIAFVNGEIYNFRDLRRELETHGARFRSHCDAEVIPHGYVTWGWEGTLRRLEGMFAICLFDRARRLILLARDPLGEKPLLYSLDDRGGFVFASQLGSLLATGRITLRPSTAALRHYVALQYVPGDLTIVEGVRKLPPGHTLAFQLRNRSLAIHQYAHLSNSSASPPARLADALAAMRRELERSVALRVYADVPVGLFLSGGIDSSALASVVRRLGAPITHSFSIGIDDDLLDESPHALRVAHHLGLEHHHLRFGLSELDRLFDQAVTAMDEPSGDAAVVPTLALSIAAREFVKVVLSGEGADEVFGGYKYYDPRFVWRLGRAALLSLRALHNASQGPLSQWLHDLLLHPHAQSTTLYQGGQALSGAPLLTSSAERSRLLSDDESQDSPYLQALATSLRAETEPLRRKQRTDLATWLPDDLLMKLDRATMAASIEGRAPYLAPPLVELGLNLPRRWKLHRGVSKWILREAFRNDLPAEISIRPKQGFMVPLRRWLLGPGRERALDVSQLELTDGLDHRAVAALFEREIAAGAARDRLLFTLLVYRHWMLNAREQAARAARIVSGGDAVAGR
jgi:asparagine synthase (glutamine-hydrolysing)